MKKPESRIRKFYKPENANKFFSILSARNIKKMKRTFKHLTILLISLSLLPIISCSTTSSTTNNKKTSSNNVLPRDREIIGKDGSSVYTSEELAKGIVKGDWAIETVNGKKVVGEKEPYLKFVPSEGKIYGNNGCNVINGQYQYNPTDSTIQFSYLSSTMMLCHKEGITDQEINLALDATRTYSWKLKGDDYLITFYNDEGTPVMELMHQNFDFLNGTWAVRQIDGENVNVSGMKLVIDVDEGKIHGNTGCNIINGTLELNMKTANSISFQSIAKTMRLCHDMKYETPLCVALEETMKARPLEGDKVEFLDSQDKVVLLLERTTDK